ncbi:unnamed protein product [Calicophoron daubneyi]|uniref:Transmembrane protein n=1 Tax=Calicophoron daubneyi TaxID=300641 RepID=A0AAV2TL22_CALDB
MTYVACMLPLVRLFNLIFFYARLNLLFHFSRSDVFSFTCSSRRPSSGVPHRSPVHVHAAFRHLVFTSFLPSDTPVLFFSHLFDCDRSFAVIYAGHPVAPVSLLQQSLFVFPQIIFLSLLPSVFIQL